MSEHRPPLDVVHNPAAQRFEVALDGDIARIDYRLADGVMRLVHTEVPPQHEGRGIAGALVRAALDHARSAGVRVLPRCSYVHSYMQRHPETHDLLPAGEAP